MRLFTAIQPSPGFRAALTDLQERLQEAGVTGKYREPDGLHLTLAFIGEWPEDVTELLPAMDYAMGKVLNRIGVPLTEDRRDALERATDLFEKISRGEITPESYAENGQLDDDTRPANAPVFAPAHPERLLD